MRDTFKTVLVINLSAWLKSYWQLLWWWLQGKPLPPEWNRKREGAGLVYTGFFSVYDRWGRPRLCVRGRVVEWPGLPTDVYLYDPPPMVRHHPHGSCLQLLKPNEAWFKLHWLKPAKDFTESCAYVERFLEESSRLEN